MTGKQLERRKIWEARFEEFDVYSGSIAKFCAERSIHSSAFYTWRKRLAPKTPMKRKPRAPKKPSFLPVAIESNPVETVPATRPDCFLPDAKWVADVMSHLIRGLS